MNTRDSKAVPELSPEDILSQLQYPEEDLRQPFRPMDETVARDLEIVRSVEVIQLLHRWKGGLGIFPPYLKKSESEWQQQLTAERVVAYGYAVSALMESALLNGFASLDEARGTVQQPAHAPTFLVYPEPGSTLAEESGTAPGTPVIYTLAHFASQIALRCDVSLENGELAWRALAHCMQEHELDGLLPGVRSESMRGEIEIWLREKYPTAFDADDSHRSER